VNVARNAVWLTVEKAAHLAGALALMTAVARYLGEADLAGYGYAISLTALFIPVLDAGLNNRTIRCAAGEPDEGRRAAEAALSLKARLALPVVLAALGVAVVSGASPSLVAAVGLIGAATVAMSAGDGLNSVFKGTGRSHVSAALVGALNLALLGSTIGAIAWRTGLMGVAFCYVVCRVGYFAAAFGLARRLVPERAPVAVVPVDRHTVKDGLLHLPCVYFLGNLLSVCYLTTYAMSGPESAASWYIGYRAAAAVFILAGAGFEAVLPAARNPGSIGLGRTLGAYLLWGLLAGAALYGLAPLSPVVFGAEYEASAHAVRVLAISLPSLVACGAAHTLLLGRGRTGVAFIGIAATFVVGAIAAVAAGSAGGPEAAALVPAAAGAVGALAMGGLVVTGRLRR